MYARPPTSFPHVVNVTKLMRFSAAIFEILSKKNEIPSKEI